MIGVDEPGLTRVGVFSLGVWRLPGLRRFLDAEVVFRPPNARGLDAIVGWGHKPTAATARRFAETHGLPYVGLEDGFVRSVGLGDEPPLSLVVDDQGIYYDARQPSRIESLLEAGDWDEATLRRAKALRSRLHRIPLSKYNHAPAVVPARWRRGERPTVLVVDQTFGDASVSQGLARAQSFDRMLEAARDEHPGARVLVKVHPDTTAGRKRGYLADLTEVEKVDEALHPVALLEEVDAVYVVTSQLGFEAALMGKDVRCFGVPFYAGWGLTKDEVRASRRTRRCTVDELAAAALIAYPRYRHPVHDERCEAEDVVEHLALQRRRLEDNDRRYHCVGFTTWKRPFVRAYLGGLGDPRGESERVRFVRASRVARERFDERSVLVVWGQRAEVEGRRSDGEAVPVWRMEDGFLRSVRLGSQLSPPGSLVLDRRGLYYDPRTPSDLEAILAEHVFTDEERQAARRLREAIVAARISKYNLAAEAPFRPKATGPVVLVVGQVDDDASVRLGSPVVPSNAALLRAARRLRPDAHLVYKPHPDVLSGNRRGASDGEELCDEVVTDRSVDACLAVADEVHTMTSLVGFEALLRGRPVVVHGQPFYAGWGLTQDENPPPRRGRKLSLDELVAGAYLLYPRYFSWDAQCFCTAEDKVRELAKQRRQVREGFASPWVVRRLRDVAILMKEWTRAR